jgi:hypothetical protein
MPAAVCIFPPSIHARPQSHFTPREHVGASWIDEWPRERPKTGGAVKALFVLPVTSLDQATWSYRIRDGVPGPPDSAVSDNMTPSAAFPPPPAALGVLFLSI